MGIFNYCLVCWNSLLTHVTKLLLASLFINVSTNFVYAYDISSSAIYTENKLERTTVSPDEFLLSNLSSQKDGEVLVPGNIEYSSKSNSIENFYSNDLATTNALNHGETLFERNGTDFANLTENPLYSTESKSMSENTPNKTILETKNILRNPYLSNVVNRENISAAEANEIKSDRLNKMSFVLDSNKIINPSSVTQNSSTIDEILDGTQFQNPLDALNLILDQTSADNNKSPTKLDVESDPINSTQDNYVTVKEPFSSEVEASLNHSTTITSTLLIEELDKASNIKIIALNDTYSNETSSVNYQGQSDLSHFTSNRTTLNSTSLTDVVIEADSSGTSLDDYFTENDSLLEQGNTLNLSSTVLSALAVEPGKTPMSSYSSVIGESSTNGQSVPSSDSSTSTQYQITSDYETSAAEISVKPEASDNTSTFSKKPSNSDFSKAEILTSTLYSTNSDTSLAEQQENSDSSTILNTSTMELDVTSDLSTILNTSTTELDVTPDSLYSNQYDNMSDTSTTIYSLFSNSSDINTQSTPEDSITITYYQEMHSNETDSIIKTSVATTDLFLNSSYLNSQSTSADLITITDYVLRQNISTTQHSSDPAASTVSNASTASQTSKVTFTSVGYLESETSHFNETTDDQTDDSVCTVCRNCTNNYIDRMISDVTSNLPEFLELPNRQGRIQLYHGKLYGLNSLKRSEPASVTCQSNENYTVMVPLRIKNAKAFYKWQVEMPLRTFYGDFNVTVVNSECRVFYSYSNTGSLVENLKITDLDGIETEFSGLGPLNDIFAGVTGTFIRFFRESFARTIENTLVHVMNAELQNVQKYEEYFNIKE